MGQLKSDGRAINVTVPAGTFDLEELYRIDGWTGILLGAVAVGDTDRKRAMEVSSERIWYVKVPAAVNGARGTMVYWTSGAGTKSGQTDLTSTATGNGEPVGKIEEIRDANGYAAIRVLNTVAIAV